MNFRENNITVFLRCEDGILAGNPNYHISVDSPMCPPLKPAACLSLRSFLSASNTALLCHLTRQMIAEYKYKLSKWYFETIWVTIKEDRHKTIAVESESLLLQKGYLIHDSHYCEFMHI